jgi:hypothetical protein
MKNCYIFIKQKFVGKMEQKLNNEKTQEAIMNKT